jgi:hypothetical protein
MPALSAPDHQRRPTMPHTCHAIGCTAPVPPKLLFCSRHWKLVPGLLRANVWAAYRCGQERDKRPSREYVRAARAAIRAVADREGGAGTT